MLHLLFYFDAACSLFVIVSFTSLCLSSCMKKILSKGDDR